MGYKPFISEKLDIFGGCSRKNGNEKDYKNIKKDIFQAWIAGCYHCSSSAF